MYKRQGTGGAGTPGSVAAYENVLGGVTDDDAGVDTPDGVANAGGVAIDGVPGPGDGVAIGVGVPGDPPPLPKPFPTRP